MRLILTTAVACHLAGWAIGAAAAGIAWAATSGEYHRLKRRTK